MWLTVIYEKKWEIIIINTEINNPKIKLRPLIGHSDKFEILS
jgi:hypothetical protein